jgi:hypothetical protein
MDEPCVPGRLVVVSGRDERNVAVHRVDERGVSFTSTGTTVRPTAADA